MASEALASVIEAMREIPIFYDGSIEKMRAGLVELSKTMELPDDVRLKETAARGRRAEWTSVDGSATDRAFLYLHGGAYVIGGIETHRLLVSNIARAAGMRALSLDYRLAPEHPYPAALDDAVAAYRFLRECGYAPAQIAIGGDSAGGGLTVATLVALRDSGEEPPAAAFCISPWLDLTMSSGSVDSRERSDPMLSKKDIAPFAAAYLNGVDPRTPTASPLFADLTGLPPLLLHVGTDEVLYDEVLELERNARGVGVDVSLEVWEDMVHVWHAYSTILPEAVHAIDRIGDFLTYHLPAP